MDAQTDTEGGITNEKIIGLLTALVLFCTCMPLVVAEETVELPTLTDLMVGKNIIWYYTDDPVRLEQITDLAWTQVGFDDTGWLTSSEQSFGARDGALEMLDGDYLPDVCLRQYKPDGRNIPTYYFRLPFVATEEDQGHTLLFEFAYDDAIIMYLNGQKVFSVNVPEEGYETSNDFGALKATVAPKETSFELDTSLLAMGENVLAVELHQDSKSSSDIYFGIEAIESPTLSADLRRNETLCLGVGADETQCLVTWRGVAGQQAYVEVAPGTLDTLPQDAKRYEATEVYTDDKVCTYRAVVTDLTPGPYSYRAVDERPSLVNTFTVSKAGTSFTFLCHGDPQILDGRSTSPIEHYDELAALVAGDTEIQFVLSLGDQSNTNDALDLFQRYTSAELLKRVPLAAVVGNHEFSSDTFSRFFYMPNMDEQTIGTSGDMSGDYWFCCGNMLVFCLNSENENVASHRRFMLDAREKCIALYGEPTWTIVAMHYSMFSLKRFWMSAMLLMWLAFSSSRILARRAFSSADRLLLVMQIPSLMLSLFHTSLKVYTILGTDSGTWACFTTGFVPLHRGIMARWSVSTESTKCDFTVICTCIPWKTEGGSLPGISAPPTIPS